MLNFKPSRKISPLPEGAQQVPLLHPPHLGPITPKPTGTPLHTPAHTYNLFHFFIPLWLTVKSPTNSYSIPQVYLSVPNSLRLQSLKVRRLRVQLELRRTRVYVCVCMFVYMYICMYETKACGVKLGLQWSKVLVFRPQFRLVYHID